MPCSLPASTKNICTSDIVTRFDFFLQLTNAPLPDTFQLLLRPRRERHSGPVGGALDGQGGANASAGARYPHHLAAKIAFNLNTINLLSSKKRAGKQTLLSFPEKNFSQKARVRSASRKNRATTKATRAARDQPNRAVRLTVQGSMTRGDLRCSALLPFKRVLTTVCPSGRYPCDPVATPKSISSSPVALLSNELTYAYNVLNAFPSSMTCQVSFCDTPVLLLLWGLQAHIQR